MRKLGLALIAVVIAASQASAQDPGWAAKLFPDGLTHDFGSVPRGAQLFYRFKMYNKWAVPINLTQIRASCGCVSVPAPEKVAALKPKETAYLEVTMDARRFTGPKSVTIYITVGPEYVSSTALTVSANSRADVVFNPGQVSFGIVSAGQTPTQNIDVEYAGILDWKVSEVVKSEAPLDVSFEKIAYPNPAPGQIGYHVKVALKPDIPAGNYKWEVLLKTNDPASPHVPILVEATIQAALTISPNPLNMDGLKVGEVTTKRIVVRGAKPFKIVSVEGTDADLSVEVPGTLAQTHVLTVQCKLAKAGEMKRTLQIKTDLGTESVVVAGTAQPAAAAKPEEPAKSNP
jgi:hypothetical protein